MSTTDEPTTSPHSRGPTYARKEVATFEFKPSSTGFTGGGYARWRSTERRPHTAREGAETVAVSVHRLAAVAWHLPDGVLGEDVHLSDLDGMDVHHVQPDTGERGMPSANGEAWTELVEHGRHSSITQSEIRAWGEDAKRESVAFDEGDVPDWRCSGCDAPDPDVRARVPAVDGDLCLDCAKANADGDPIELVD